MKKTLTLILICLLLIPAALAEDSRIGIISAMQNEIDLLLENTAIDRVDTIGGVDFNVGTLCGQPVVIGGEPILCLTCAFYTSCARKEGQRSVWSPPPKAAADAKRRRARRKNIWSITASSVR